MRLRRRQSPEPALRRQVQRGGSTAPAFSYYNNRPKTEEPGRPTSRSPGSTGKLAPATAWRTRILKAGLTFWLLMAVVVICAAKLLSLSTSPKVIIVGQTSTTKAYLRPTGTYAAAAHRLLADSPLNRLKPLADVNGVATGLEHQFPELQSASMAIPLVGSRPVVYIQGAAPQVVLKSAHGDYALNARGLVLARLPNVPRGVPVVRDESDGKISRGKQYLPASTVAFIQIVQYQLHAAHLAVSNYDLPAANPYELDAHLAGQRYYVKFNLINDPTEQSGAAIAVIQHLGGHAPKQYLDVRVPGRAYYL